MQADENEQNGEARRRDIVAYRRPLPAAYRRGATIPSKDTSPPPPCERELSGVRGAHASDAAGHQGGCGEPRTTWTLYQQRATVGTGAAVRGRRSATFA